jgi:histidinol-phosphate/aromatic aminotransferase/cobyric acid decarboxylase-like protein
LLIQRSQTILVVDESYVMFSGPDWKKISVINLLSEFPDRIMVVMSWNKALSCAALRLGSLIASRPLIQRVAALQAPWSVNGFAQDFFIAAIQETNYFDEMWATAPGQKEELIRLLKEIGVRPYEKPPLWVPFVYVDFLNCVISQKAEQVALDAGFPVRSCESFGYPHYIRLAVRPLNFVRELIEAWRSNTELMELIKARR